MRWYLAFRRVGFAPRLIQDVSWQVENGNLGAHVPVLRVEKKARGEFYVFLGIESPKAGEIPLQAMPVVDYLGRPNDGAFTPQDIRGMTTGDVDFIEYSRRLRYQPARPIWDDDPFDPMDDDTEVEEDAVQRSQRYDKLLFWISAVGSGTWPQFRAACEALGTATRPAAPRQVLRRFRLLGHLETSVDATAWSVAPAVLIDAVSFDGESSSVLCGQRDSGLLQDLHRSARVVETIQPCGQAPASVRVLGNAPSVRVDGREVLWGGGAANLLTDALPELPEWTAALAQASFLVPHAYSIRPYNGYVFEDAEFVAESGLYELHSSTPQTTQRPPLTLFYDAELSRWVRGDWYGLRFLACQALGMQMRARFDNDKCQLALQIHQRWPELYERALVLSSGVLPRRTQEWLVYESISLAVARLLAQKLCVSLEEEGVRA
jgi:hypothetical protein